jgi:hypothetical protein
MSELPERNKFQNQRIETESEVDKSDGSKKLINLPDIT